MEKFVIFNRANLVLMARLTIEDTLSKVGV